MWLARGCGQIHENFGFVDGEAALLIPARELGIRLEVFFHEVAFDTFEFFAPGIDDHGGQELAADALAAEIGFHGFAAEQASQNIRLRHDASVLDEHVREHEHIFLNPAIDVGGAGPVEFEAEIDELIGSFLGKFKDPTLAVADELFHGAFLNGFNLNRL